METVTGQSPSTNGTGVLGIAFPDTEPGTENIGVKGDGGNASNVGTPPGAPGIAIGVFGTCAGTGVGVKGANTTNNANGFLGGVDPKFHNQAGAYGESAQQGVIGHATSDTGTGVFGDSTGGGFGVRGETLTGIAVQGRSLNFTPFDFGGVATGWLGGSRPDTSQPEGLRQVGVYGESDTLGVVGHSLTSAGIGVSGDSQGAGGGVGVFGETEVGIGVKGLNSGSGAFGFLGGVDPKFNNQAGVYGQSAQQGVIGHATADTGTGVFGDSTGGGFGVRGEATTGIAVQGVSLTTHARGFLGGVDPKFNNQAGVYGESAQQGVIGHATADTGTGVFGDSTGGGFGVRGETTTGIAVQGESFGTGLAGKFLGNVQVTGKFIGNVECSQNITAFDVVLSGADCAEDFDIAGPETVDPGTVMVMDNKGTLSPCDRAYDRKVTGVISGAGDYKPGIVLDKRRSEANRLPLALVGKVYCKVDAEFGSVEVGDLLTTSATPGHAMKVRNTSLAFGAVIGKALRPIAGGRGLIPILVALQ